MALTRRQREVLDFIEDFIRTKRYSPSLEEIAKHFGLSSVATVHKHVVNLEKKGFIRRDWNRSRSIDVAPPPRPVLTAVGGGGLVAETNVADFPGAIEAFGHRHEPDADAEWARMSEVVRLPLQGRVAAGLPIEAIRDHESVAVPASMVGRGRSYVLQVKGDSMIGEHIQDGDFVIVEERREARNGEKVIALIGDGEATLKTYFRDPDGTVRLEPANPSFKTIRVREGSFRIQGVVIGVLRRFRP